MPKHPLALKVPDRQRCPCCGVALSRGVTVEPRCESIRDCDGAPVDWVLLWRCIDCGCEWPHSDARYAEMIREEVGNEG